MHFIGFENHLLSCRTFSPTRILRFCDRRIFRRIWLTTQNLKICKESCRKQYFLPPDNVILGKISNFASYFSPYPSGSFYIMRDFYNSFYLLYFCIFIVMSLKILKMKLLFYYIFIHLYTNFLIV